MNNLVRGVVAVAGCVVLAGSSFANEPYARGYFNEEGRYVPPDMRKPLPEAEVDSKRPRRKVEPAPVQVGTPDALRGKRPR